MPIARSYENGLVVAPPKLDCLGESCPTARSLGRCYVSEHHLYFPRHVYDETGLLKEFRSNKFNIIRMPRCMHSMYHRQISFVSPPSNQVMEEFLEQASILADLGIATDDLLMQRERLEAPYATPDWARVEYSAEGPDPLGRSRFEALYLDRLAGVVDLAQFAVREVSIVPFRQIVEPHVLGAKALQPILDLPLSA